MHSTGTGMTRATTHPNLGMLVEHIDEILCRLYAGSTRAVALATPNNKLEHQNIIGLGHDNFSAAIRFVTRGFSKKGASWESASTLRLTGVPVYYSTNE
jgi:hypothetical protein